MAAVKPVGKLYVTVESASVMDKESEQWTKALSASLKGAVAAETVGAPSARQRRPRDTRHAALHREPGMSAWRPGTHRAPLGPYPTTDSPLCAPLPLLVEVRDGSNVQKVRRCTHGRIPRAAPAPAGEWGHLLTWAQSV